MKCHLKCAMLLLPLIGLMGCMGSDGPPVMPKADKMAARQVMFASPDLSESIAVGRITRMIDTSGILQITVPLKATTDLDLNVDYRISYFDDSHNPVDAPGSWQTTILHAGNWESIQGSGSSNRAKDFQLELRWKQ